MFVALSEAMTKIAGRTILVIALAFFAPRGAGATSIALPAGASETFTWVCDWNCDAKSLSGFAVSLDLEDFYLGWTGAPFSGKFRAGLLGGEALEESLLGSQNPGSVANVLGAYNDEVLDELVIQLSGPAAFQYEFNDIELTAHAKSGEIRDWYLNAIGSGEKAVVGHFK